MNALLFYIIAPFFLFLDANNTIVFVNYFYFYLFIFCEVLFLSHNNTIFNTWALNFVHGRTVNTTKCGHKNMI